MDHHSFDTTIGELPLHVVIIYVSLVPRPLPAFQCCTLSPVFQRATLKSWEWPGDEANICSINFMNTLQVSKKHVDSYQPHKRIPHCELLAEFESATAETRVTPLCHRVKLLGAKQPYNMLILKPPTITVNRPISFKNNSGMYVIMYLPICMPRTSNYHPELQATSMMECIYLHIILFILHILFSCSGIQISHIIIKFYNYIRVLQVEIL